MKIVALSDIHGRISSLKSISHEVETAAVIVVAGDITHFGGREALFPVLDEIKKYNASILAVPGNCDLPEVEKGLAEAGVSVNKRSASVGGTVFAGIGGSLPCPSRTPNELSEQEYGNLLQGAPFSSLPQRGFVLVSHQPPFNTKADKAWIGRHVGSISIRDFIETKKPVLCISGHIHESPGIDAIGETRIINPGAFKNGHYAVIEMEGAAVRGISLKKT